MLLANVAWLLASSGKRVLTIDWDLEAPGLHHYFHPFLIDKRLIDSDGLIDMVIAQAAKAASASMTRAAPAKPADTAAAEPPEQTLIGVSGTVDQPAISVDPKNYMVGLNWSFDRGGSLRFMPAGRQDLAYATRVNTFEWRTFYERLGGESFFRAWRDKLREEYEYVLIDSRTGASDTSSICTVVMPDDLVVCFTPSDQNIQGAVSIIASVRQQRERRAAASPQPPPESGTASPTARSDSPRIFPMLTRVDVFEKNKMEAARDLVAESFADILPPLSPTTRNPHWANADVFYVPYYVYEETLAVFADKEATTGSILSAAQTVARLVTDGAVSTFEPPPPDKREQALAAFERKRPGQNPDVVILLGPDDWRDGHAVIEALKADAQLRVVPMSCEEWLAATAGDRLGISTRSEAAPSGRSLIFYVGRGGAKIPPEAIERLNMVVRRGGTDRVVVFIGQDAPPDLSVGGIEAATILDARQSSSIEDTIFRLQYLVKGSGASLSRISDANVRQRRSLVLSAEEWIKSNRKTDYLLRGSQLEATERLLEQTADLLLTDREQEFLAASRKGRDADEAAAMRLELPPLRAEVERLRQEIPKAKAEAESARREATELRTEAGGLRQQLPQVQAEADRLRQELSAVNENASIVREESNALRGEAALAQAKNAFNENVLAAAREKLEETRVNARRHERRTLRLAGTLIAAGLIAVLLGFLFVRAETELQGAKQMVLIAEAQLDKIRSSEQQARAARLEAEAALQRANTARMVTDLTAKAAGLGADRQELAVLLAAEAFRRSQGRDGTFDDDARRFVAKMLASVNGWPLRGHGGAVTSARYFAGGTRILTTSQDGTARIWDAVTGWQVSILVEGRGPISAADVDNAGGVAVLGFADSRIGIWNLADGRQVGMGKLPFERAAALRFGGNGERLLVVSDRGMLAVVDARNMDKTIVERRGPFAAAALSMDGRRIAAATPDFLILILDATKGGVLQEIDGRKIPVAFIAFAPEGRSLVVGSVEGRARLLELAPLNELPLALSNPGGKRVSVGAVGPDFQQVAMGFVDGGVLVWSLQTSGVAPATLLRGHSDWISDVSFGPDGNTIVTASSDRTARMWSIARGSVPGTEAREASFAGLLPQELLDRAQQYVGRNMNCAEWRTFFPTGPYEKTFQALPGPASDQADCPVEQRGTGK